MIIGGRMETGSNLMAGIASGDVSFFSTAHGLSLTRAGNGFRATVTLDV